MTERVNTSGMVYTNIHVHLGQALLERGYTPWQLSNMITYIHVHLGQTTNTTITHAFREANMATQYPNWGTLSSDIRLHHIYDQF